MHLSSLFRYSLAFALTLALVSLFTGCGEQKKPTTPPEQSVEQERTEESGPEAAETPTEEPKEESASSKETSAASAKAMPTLAELSGKIEKDLINSSGKAYDKSPLEKADYLAIYYSAHWCPPCRKFTPKLVQFYNEVKPKHANFELVFVSADHSEKAMLEYMKEVSMPWPALKYAVATDENALTNYEGDGIPHLVFLNKEGKLLSSSVENGEYVGPQKVIEDIKKTLNK